MRIWQVCERSRGGFLRGYIDKQRRSGYKKMPQDLWQILSTEGESQVIKIYRVLGSDNDYDFFLSVTPDKLIPVPKPVGWIWQDTLYHYVKELYDKIFDDIQWHVGELKLGG